MVENTLPGIVSFSITVILSGLSITGGLSLTSITLTSKFVVALYTVPSRSAPSRATTVKMKFS